MGVSLDPVRVTVMVSMGVTVHGVRRADRTKNGPEKPKNNKQDRSKRPGK